MILLHLPFLWADPDLYISEGRGPFTDEGLNCGQLRNFINQGQWTLYEGDNLIKTPLFAGILYLPFYLLGSELWVGRLWILLLSLLLVLGTLRLIPIKNLIYAVIPMSLLGFSVFHYMHYCMAEMLCVATILGAVCLMLQALEKDKPVYSLGAGLLLSSAFWLKIQFLYAMPLLGFLSLAAWAYPSKKIWWKHTLIANAIIAASLLLFYLAWYLPHEEFLKYVMADQTKGRFKEWAFMGQHLVFVFQHHFWNEAQWLNTLVFLISLFFGVRILFQGQLKTEKFFLGALLIWILVESHKLGMVYLPSRYLVSLYFAMGIFSAAVMALYWPLQLKFRWNKVLISLFVSLFFIKNGVDYAETLQRRSYQLETINAYIARHYKGSGPMLGAWTQSLNWSSKGLAYPVWAGYFNDKDPINHFKPEIIVTEPGEEDSNQAYQLQGIQLSAQADSVRQFRLGHWDLNIWWMKQR